MLLLAFEPNIAIPALKVTSSPAQKRARQDRARCFDQTIEALAYSVVYLNSGIAVRSSLVALNTA
jgi:hypothetical protein